MTNQDRLESVGWVFFGVAVAVMLGPCIYVVLKLTHDALTIGMRVATGAVLAFFAAGFISWFVNSMLHSRAQRLDTLAAETARLEARKSKAPKKKKD